MSKNKKRTYSISISFLSMLTVLSIYLKLTHQIEWSWLWVLCPLWITPAILLAVIAAVLLVMACAGLVIVATAGVGWLSKAANKGR